MQIYLYATSMMLVLAQTAPSTAPVPSPAENTAIQRHIATLKSPADRSVANGWPDAKKVAELICRPSALPVVKRHLPGTDRVFLGTDDPATLTLESDRRLTGTGSARTPKGWRDFSFACALDPVTGKVTAFTLAPIKAGR